MVYGLNRMLKSEGIELISHRDEWAVNANVPGHVLDWSRLVCGFTEPHALTPTERAELETATTRLADEADASAPHQLAQTMRRRTTLV